MLPSARGDRRWEMAAMMTASWENRVRKEANATDGARRMDGYGSSYLLPFRARGEQSYQSRRDPKPTCNNRRIVDEAIRAVLQEKQPRDERRSVKADVLPVHLDFCLVVCGTSVDRCWGSRWGSIGKGASLSLIY
jgi:hypothetical protein